MSTSPGDLLVALYGLPDPSPGLARLAKDGVVVRRALTYEKYPVVRWVGATFGEGWAGECDASFGTRPVSCLIATARGALLGFACIDSPWRGFLGPVGVDAEARGRGIGRALALGGLHALFANGHAYAMIGAAGAREFYAKVAPTWEIPDSYPGGYRDRLAGAGGTGS